MYDADLGRVIRAYNLDEGGKLSINGFSIRSDKPTAASAKIQYSDNNTTKNCLVEISIIIKIEEVVW